MHTAYIKAPKLREILGRNDESCEAKLESIKNLLSGNDEGKVQSTKVIDKSQNLQLVKASEDGKLGGEETG